MEALTTKELEYIIDSMSNEDLLMKQCTMAAASTQNQMIHNVCLDLLQQHHQHFHTLMNSLNQHLSLAGNQAQQY